MQKIIRISIVLIVVWELFMVLPEGGCFTLEQSDDAPLLIRENAPASTSQAAFTIQDNLRLYSPVETSEAFLLPVSDNFISADIIDSNLPVFSQFRYPSTLGRDPFANFLYANLRMNKLLQEYAEVQSRAEALLSSASQSRGIDTMTQNAIQQPKENITENKDQEQENLFKALQQLQRSMTSITTPEQSNYFATLHSARSAQTSENPLLSVNQLPIAPGRVNQAATKASNIKIDNLPSSGYSQLHSASSSPPAAHAQQRTTPTSYADLNELKLPWILNLPFELLRFCFDHKIVFFVTVYLLLGLLTIIFGSRS